MRAGILDRIVASANIEDSYGDARWLPRASSLQILKLCPAAHIHEQSLAISLRESFWLLT